MNTSNIFSIVKNLNLTKVLGGANKTLNFVKQAVPVYKEIKPLFSSGKNIINTFKGTKEIKPAEKKIVSRPISKKQPLKNINLNNNLTFFQ